MDDDRRGELDEERRFLLGSLADLEREHEAGDVDDLDYEQLKDGYTVRAAATIRAIAGESSEPIEEPLVNWPRRLIGAGVVVVLVVLVWWVLAATTAQRLPGQEITGLDPRSERQTLLAQARAVQAQNPGEAAAIYALVLDDDPANVEAMTYGGWTLALSTLFEDDQQIAEATLAEGVDLLVLAIETDPTYADPFCFLGIIEFRFAGDAASAEPFIAGCLAANPPADVRDLVSAIAEEIAIELEG